jgi:hypothetical protein
MTDNAQFPEPWPAPAPAIGVLTATFERYREALDAPSGQVELKLNRLEGAGSYEVHTAQGDPLIEANWHYAQVSMLVRRIVLDHLAPLQRAWVRVRGVGGQGAGRWSDPASIVVL